MSQCLFVFILVFISCSFTFCPRNSRVGRLFFTVVVLLLVVRTRCKCARAARVILDSYLAELYQVETKRLNDQVKRNYDRFPKGFMFQLTSE